MPTDILYMVPNTSPGKELILDEKGQWDGLTFRKELIYKGKFVKAVPGKEPQHFTVDEKKLVHWERTGNKMVANGVKVPVPVKHTDEPERNRAKVLRYETGINDKGLPALFGVVRFRDPEAAKLAASTDVSIFVPAEPFVDGKGNKYDYCIKHIALTDYPVIPGLSDFQAIAASYEQPEFDAKKIAKRLMLSNGVDKPLTRGEHATEAAVHGVIGGLEYQHAKHILKHLAGNSAKRQFKKGGIGLVAKSALRGGIKNIARRYVVPAAFGALAAHGLYHSIKGVAQHLAAIPKTPKQPKPVTALSLEYDKNEPRDKKGEWAQRGRNIASIGVKAAAGVKATKTIAVPLAYAGLRALAKRHKMDLPKLSDRDKLAAGVDFAGGLIHAASLYKVANRIKKPPSEEKASTATKVASGVVGAHLGALGIHHAALAALRGAQTVHFGRLAQSLNGDAKIKLLGHAIMTRPLAAAAITHAAAAGGLGYSSRRALKKAFRKEKESPKELSLSTGRVTLKMRRDAEKAQQKENIAHPNIYGRNRLGRFAPKPSGHASTKELRRLNRTTERIHNLKDESDEDLKPHQKLQAALQVGKHVSLGAIEGGGAALGLMEALRRIKTATTGISKSPLSSRGNAVRIAHLRKLGEKFAVAATALGIAGRRANAIHTHLRTLFSRSKAE